MISLPRWEVITTIFGNDYHIGRVAATFGHLEDDVVRSDAKPVEQDARHAQLEADCLPNMGESCHIRVEGLVVGGT